ncbi:MAG: hypothetical protein ABIH76_04185, partial [Candidatus Bathyarchaeota archaeon]
LLKKTVTTTLRETPPIRFLWKKYKPESVILYGFISVKSVDGNKFSIGVSEEPFNPQLPVGVIICRTKFLHAPMNQTKTENGTQYEYAVNISPTGPEAWIPRLLKTSTICVINV